MTMETISMKIPRPKICSLPTTSKKSKATQDFYPVEPPKDYPGFETDINFNDPKLLSGNTDSRINLLEQKFQKCDLKSISSVAS